jgi:hypothetical protein
LHCRALQKFNLFIFIFIIIIIIILDALFLLNVYNGLKICPTLLETVGLRVPNRNFRDFKLLC